MRSFTRWLYPVVAILLIAGGITVVALSKHRHPYSTGQATLLESPRVAGDGQATKNVAAIKFPGGHTQVMDISPHHYQGQPISYWRDKVDGSYSISPEAKSHYDQIEHVVLVIVGAFLAIIGILLFISSAARL